MNVRGRNSGPVKGSTSRRAWRRVAPVLLLSGLLMACDSVEERAEKHYQSGIALLEGGETAKAALEFRNVIRLDEAHVGALMALGQIYEDNSDFSSAVHQYRRVVETDPSVLEAHIRLGQMMLAFNEVDEAVKSAVAAGQLAPEDPRTLMLRAAVAMRTGENERARELGQQSIEIDENFGDGWTVLAAVSRIEGDLETALEQVEEALRREPSNVKAALFRLNLLGEMGRDEAVGDAFAELVEQHPNTITFLEAYARWQLLNDEFVEVEDTLRRLWDLAPNDVNRSLDIVRLVARTKGREAAMGELRNLMERAETDSVRAMLQIATAEFELEDGDIAAAAERLEAVIGEAQPTSFEGVLARVRLARVRIAQRDIEAAKPLLDEALAEDPTNAHALTLRGRVRIHEENYDAAISDLRTAEAEQPDTLEVVKLLSIAHERNGSADLALERAASAVQLSDYGTEEVLRHVNLLTVAGRPNVAIGQLEEARKRRPEDPALIAALARLYLGNGDFGSAEALAQQVRATAELTEIADRIMAAALSGQQRHDETIELLEEAYTEAEDGRSYLGALISAHLRTGDTGAALALLDERLAETPDNADALRIKGTILLGTGDPEEARALLERAIEIEPERDVNHLALYRYHGTRGNPEAAEKTLREGIEITDSGLLHLNLAMLLETLGRPAEAVEVYEILYARNPDSALVANNLASLMTDLKPNDEEIERAFVIAKRLRDSRVPHFLDTYGWLQYLRGDLIGARATLEKSAEGLPNNPVAQYHLGVVLAELGLADRARERLEAALTLAGDRPMPQIDPAREILARLDGEAGSE